MISLHCSYHFWAPKRFWAGWNGEASTTESLPLCCDLAGQRVEQDAPVGPGGPFSSIAGISLTGNCWFCYCYLVTLAWQWKISSLPPFCDWTDRWMFNCKVSVPDGNGEMIFSFQHVLICWHVSSTCGMIIIIVGMNVNPWINQITGLSIWIIWPS